MCTRSCRKFHLPVCWSIQCPPSYVPSHLCGWASSSLMDRGSCSTESAHDSRLKPYISRSLLWWCSSLSFSFYTCSFRQSSSCFKHLYFIDFASYNQLGTLQKHVLSYTGSQKAGSLVKKRHLQLHHHSRSTKAKASMTVWKGSPQMSSCRLIPRSSTTRPVSVHALLGLPWQHCQRVQKLCGDPSTSTQMQGQIMSVRIDPPQQNRKTCDVSRVPLLQWRGKLLEGSPCTVIFTPSQAIDFFCFFMTILWEGK